jgi:signal peptidase I
VFFIPSFALAAFGIQLHTVTTGSMRPEIKPGDLVITRLENMNSVKVGQVILFLDNKSRNPISHRVISVAVSGQNINVTTKGDANPVADGTITEPTTFKISKVVTVVAGMGWVVAALHTSAAKYLLLALLVLLAIMFVAEKRLAMRKKKEKPEKIELPEIHPYVVEGKSHV